ncbi:MAG TPA: AAA family ATPase [Candidatus Saccharimonadales bacterium]|nr:AAA family ATPase [Candidatus Saccharimonadales bacterium]
MKVIGVCGTNGSGKDTVARMLADRHGWMMVQYSDFLREEARKRGLPIERKHLSSISAEWRAKHGHSILTDKAADLFRKSKDGHEGLVVLSMRHPGEAKKVKELGGVVVWVDADPRIRYQRIAGRGRSSEDMKTYEQFLAEEEAEMHYSGHEATLSMSKVKEMADVFLENDADDIEAFKDKAEKALAKYL